MDNIVKKFENHCFDTLPTSKKSVNSMHLSWVDDRIYAQAFPGENCVRIIFQRRDKIREIKVPVPEML